jgi:bile acid-coenzyme A ligase
MTRVAAGQRIDDLAAAHPRTTAITFVPRSGAESALSWGDLARQSTQAARLLETRGVRQGSMVVVVLPNSLEHFIVSIAVWKMGGCVLPLPAVLPPWERDPILELADPVLVIGDPASPGVTRNVLARAELRWSDLTDDPLPPRMPTPGGAVASGGSTGRPKIIIHPGERAFDTEVLPLAPRGSGFQPGWIQIVGGPMYHGGPFGWAHFGLFYDQSLVLLEKFEGSAWVSAVERHRAEFAFLVPAMMRRILDVPDLRVRDLSSLRMITHGGAPCAPWVKREWISLIGGARLREGYGAIEGIGNTIIDGDEWLAHPGSVGRGFDTDVRILDDAQQEVERGTIGEIYMRPRSPTEFTYVGSAPPKGTADGFRSVGDIGWMDEDGHLYIADRRVDMIISGGANVYPAEVEAALSDHPKIRDIVVIGLPDDRWGQRVHAIVEPASPVAEAELDAYARERLARFKVPKTYEFIEHLPRNEAGKIRRSALIEERRTEHAAEAGS